MKVPIELQPNPYGMTHLLLVENEQRTDEVSILFILVSYFGLEGVPHLNVVVFTFADC